MQLKHIVFFLLFSNLAWAEAPESSYAPEWTRDPKRHVVGGDIIHWGTGEATTIEVAVFKARHMAIKAMIEECGGIANKDIIPQKQYVESRYGFRSYAQVSLSFASCEAAKGKDGKKFENRKLVQEQQYYEKLIGLRNDDERDLSEGPTPAEEAAEAMTTVLKQHADGQAEQLGALRNEISALRMELHKKRQKQDPTGSAEKILCEARYQAMKRMLQMHAQDYNNNVAAPELMGEFNNLQSQGAICAKMK